MPVHFLINLDKKLIFLVMIVSVVALATTAFLTFNFAESVLKEKVTDQLISESSTRGNSISTLFDTRIKETRILATDPMIQIIVNELNQLKSDSELDLKIKEKRRDLLIEIKAFRELVGYSIGFADVKIIGKNGHVFFSLGRLDKNDFLDNPRYIKGLTESFVEFEPTVDGGRKMIVTTPIFVDATNTESIGVIIAEMSTVEIDNILLNRGGLGTTGEVYLVNNNFLMISESRFIKNAAFTQKVNTIPVIKCFEEGIDFGGRYQDYRKASVYGQSYCAKDLGFVLLAEIDELETFHPVLVLQDRIFLTGMIITAGMAIATFFLSKLISKPIIKLRNAANEIANGNFDIRTNIKTGDEIGQLSSSFDVMAKKLQESLIAIKQREDVIKQQQDLLLQFSDHSENYCVGLLDIIDSTKITAKLSDLQSSKFYTLFLNSMAAIIRKFDGIVVKNIGDALLFYFPKTNTQEIPAFKNALECCLTISEYHHELIKKLEQEKLPSLNYRISATYDPVRIAKIATSSVGDIFGSTVNKCAKINQFAPENGVIIGSALHQMTKSIDMCKFEIVNNPSVINEYGNVYTVTRK